MVIICDAPMGKLKGHWLLTDNQYQVCKYLFNNYRRCTGHKFDKRLRAWLFFNQKTRLKKEDFLNFLSLFEICAESHPLLDCRTQCQQYTSCLEVFDIINDRADYSPNKIGDSDNSYSSEPPILHGKAAELLKFLDGFTL